MSAQKMISIVAAVIRNDEGQVLLVRKAGTQAFMQPGGKRENGEEDVTALVREIYEELGCAIDQTSAAFLGQFQAPAANEPDHIVDASVYDVRVYGDIYAQAEIEEMMWVDPSPPGNIILAPLTRDHILPFVAAKYQKAA